MTVNAIDVSHLTVCYDRVSVLWDIDFSVPSGQMTAVIGPNGAGKSTFMKTMLGLVHPLSGHVKVLGKSIKSQRKKIAYVPQRESIDWDFPMTVEELVLQGLYPKLSFLKWTRSSDRVKAIQALAKVDMERFATRQINELSVGQKQRIFLARAILQDADVYFLDEPCSGVDSVTSDIIFNLLKELKNEGKSIFVIHHDLKTIQDHFDWVVLLNMRLIACGPVVSTLSAENLRMTYGQSTNLFEEAFALSQHKMAGVKSS